MTPQELAEKEYPYEEWRDVIGYEGYYQVSNHGRVKSLDREYVNIRSGLCQLKGMQIKLQKHRGLYLRVSLSKNGVIKSRSVHRMVATALIPNPDNKPQINHKDLNPANNYYENLEWSTGMENTTHFHKNNPSHRLIGSKWRAKGEKIHTTKLTEDNVRQIRSSTLTARTLAKAFGVSYRCIVAVKCRENWKWVI